MKDKIKKKLKVGNRKYVYYSLKEAKKNGATHVDKLPRSLKILLENLLRNLDGKNITWDDIMAIDQWVEKGKSDQEIAWYPARVLMQDFTGVPGVVDLAAMREAIGELGGKAEQINPQTPVDLVIDHSVNVDHFGDKNAFEKNVKMEYQRNKERYFFLKWGQSAFQNFRVVPPGTGIVHQVNLEYLAKVVWTQTVNGEVMAYPDTLVGTDSHTTMVGGLSVLGWGVGGIEAEAAMLGRSITMLIPEVIGLKMTGKLPEGTTATDLVLHVVEKLRKYGVVGKFVEFFGEGLSNLTLADRATLSNMAPEYGATCGLFPIDDATIEYLKFSGRSADTVALVEAYAKEQGLWMDPSDSEPTFTDVLELDLKTITPCVAGPKRPQDKINLHSCAKKFKQDFKNVFSKDEKKLASTFPVSGKKFSMQNGNVVLAAITSCTNTSNPSVLVGAGLLAKKAVEKGLMTKPWVKTSLAPGSKVVTDYLVESGLQKYLNQLGFHLVGYGCTTCIGNSGPLPLAISKSIDDNDLVAVSVLSGNRNFEGRINPDVRANYLASPPLVVAYALAGNMSIDLTKEALGVDSKGKKVFLKDLWPKSEEINQIIGKHLTSKMYRDRYRDVFTGDAHWKSIKTPAKGSFSWDKKSTYIRKPPFFDNITEGICEDFSLDGAHILALLGDSVTTDHISPAGSIPAKGPAGLYLQKQGVAKIDFNSFGSRRGNHEVMMRGTFANIRIKNEMVAGEEGGVTKHVPSGKVLSIYDAAMKYKQEGTPLVVIAGTEYGTGSSRDWAAKGTALLGVKAVITESFERIHRSNLIGMGILPLQFTKGTNRKNLKLDGSEKISLALSGKLAPGMKVKMIIHAQNKRNELELSSRIDTADELDYFKNGGILHYVLRHLGQGA